MMVFRILATTLVLSCFISVGLSADGAFNPMPYPPLPEAISSFGATIAGDSIYVFGGHMGRVPGSSVDGLSPHFCRLNLSAHEAGWEELPMRDSSQSPGLVAWAGKVYRVGGLSFHNRTSEETSFHSLDLFSQFDPATKTWQEMPAMPVPRSSLDAAVVDGKVYVIGGWNLQGVGSQSAVWHEDALVYDLVKEENALAKGSGEWSQIATPPFQTRALAVAGYRHKLYVLGGMKSNNQTTRDVHRYDPASNTWSKGPELKSNGNFGGFAIAAFAMGDKLYYCGGDGTIYVLNEGEDDWQPVERLLFSRMFHRLVPAGEDKLVVLGGVSGGNYLASLEVVHMGRSDPNRAKSVEWSVPFVGDARHSQSLLVHATSLYAFGGNKSVQPHDFSEEAFANQAFRFELASRTVEPLADLPQGVQSGGAFVAGSRIDQSIYVVGGLSFEDGKYGSTDRIQQYRLRSKAWSEETQRLPASRAMFGVATFGGAAWIFGGSQVKTATPGLVAETWEWNLANEDALTVVAEAEIPVRRRSFGGTVLNDRYYAIGGLGDNSGIVAVTNVFDFKTRSWSEVPAPAKSRVFPSVAASGGKVYLAGGFSSEEGHFVPCNAIEVFDPQTNSWQAALTGFDPKLAQMTMLEFQDRLLFYTIDQTQPGLAHFVLVDPKPTTVGFGAISTPGEERAASSVMANRLMRLDKNQDGKLTPDEVTGRFQPIIARVDENKDGIATKEEIEAFVRREEEASRTSAGGPETRGGGSRREGGAPIRDAGRILDENDVDKNGKLSGDEIPARLRGFVEKADADRDGSIDKSELEVLLKSARTGRNGER